MKMERGKPYKEQAEMERVRFSFPKNYTIYEEFLLCVISCHSLSFKEL